MGQEFLRDTDSPQEAGVPDVAGDRTQLILDGIERIANHLFGDAYLIGDTKVSAAKAACLAALLKQERIDQAPTDLRFDPDRIADLRDATIHRWPVLNRLKAISPEAFHYWVLSEQFEKSG